MDTLFGPRLSRKQRPRWGGDQPARHDDRTVRCYICAMTSPSVREQLEAFVAERDWSQFHTPSNLAKSISIEAAELLEVFQWSDDADEARVREELADVLTYCHLLAYRLGAEPADLILNKLVTTRSKYPVEKSRGRSAKYTDL